MPKNNIRGLPATIKDKRLFTPCLIYLNAGGLCQAQSFVMSADVITHMTNCHFLFYLCNELARNLTSIDRKCSSDHDET